MGTGNGNLMSKNSQNLKKLAKEFADHICGKTSC